MSSYVPHVADLGLVGDDQRAPVLLQELGGDPAERDPQLFRGQVIVILHTHTHTQR